MTSRLAGVRAALHAALPGGDVISADRAHAYPQAGQYPTPCAWVGIPTVTAGRGSTTATFPVALLVDGASEEQLATLDEETARLWDALRGVRYGGVKANVTRTDVQSFGPEGSSTLGVVLTVSVELAALTLCDAPQLVDTP